MDFDKLIEPYSENGRTLGLQIKWLIKNGIPQSSIDYAVSSVYKRIENGETFKDGDALDQELRNVARKHHEDELSEQMKKRIGEISANLDVEWNKLTKWEKIKQVIQGLA
jgi:hypothetical protein